MKRTILYTVTIIILLGSLSAYVITSRGTATQGTMSVLAQQEYPSRVAAPGRVEPVSEEIKVSSEIRGKIKSVLVEEGDAVKSGQVLAVLENDDFRAQVASAEARLAQRKAELRLVLNGARDQERREVLESVKEAEAMLENAGAEMGRRQSLYEKGVIAREESDRAEREYKVAKARFDAARQRHALINDDAREEDSSRARADVAVAQAQLDEARARLEKTFIRSPIDGVILRKHLNSGESVSDMREMPIITVANVSTLRIRVDVDETDVSKLLLNQRAYVTADAFGTEKFWGRVVRIGQALGKKNIRTDEPNERVDTKILETLIELEDGHKLPSGLRVDSFIIVAEQAR
ncbi:MAG TPA: efflux RND transporter periplasmic adaptor subunit [Blastocatellia bacterium]|jgi:HlyD family secretion protein|nr:efflux RND transporter periplasmic adaptor subunit [Blastocatellia bacterium]